jgi:alanine dehydrogenase
MIIGIPAEIKNNEYRVGATPQMVRAFVEAGHKVRVQKGAGAGSGFLDEGYIQAGASMADGPKEVYEAEMVIKVKEPQPSEYPLLREGLILFCYLHLAPDPIQTAELVEKKVVAIAYETVTDGKNGLPLLLPMSEIAGRLSIQVGATCLQMNHGGRGVLLGGVPGVLPAHVTIIGGGVVGTEAARMALGLGAHVTVLDKNLDRLRTLNALYGPSLKTLYSSSGDLEEEVIGSDLVIGAVLVPGKTAPKLVTRKMISKMAPGSVVVDVAIDQGGCFETSRPTTHADPTYVVGGVIHYAVTNMPGAAPRTSTLALTHATLAYALEIASKGWKLACLENPYLREGLNVALGKVTNEAVAEELGYEYVPSGEVI